MMPEFEVTLQTRETVAEGKTLIYYPDTPAAG